jgi:hypothetical protein
MALAPLLCKEGDQDLASYELDAKLEILRRGTVASELEYSDSIDVTGLGRVREMHHSISFRTRYECISCIPHQLDSTEPLSLKPIQAILGSLLDWGKNVR